MSKIDKVEPRKIIQREDSWHSVLKAFNPLGTAAKAYAETLAYRLEAKRLAVEAERIQAQAQTINNAINKTFQLKLEELQHRRIALERTFDIAEQQLHQLHIERMEVLKMANLAMKKTLEAGLSIEERTLFKELATEFTKQLPSFGDKANQNLSTLVTALPIIEMPRALTDKN